DGYEQRALKSRAALEQLDRRASELNVLIQGLNAELVAAEKYYRDTQAKQHTPAPEFQRMAKEDRAAIDSLERQQGDLRNQDQAGKETTGVGDAMVQEEQQARQELIVVLGKERA